MIKKMIARLKTLPVFFAQTTQLDNHQCDVLYIANIADLYFIQDQTYISPLLNSVQQPLSYHNIAHQTLLAPYSATLKGTLSINRSFFWSLLIYKIKTLFYPSQKAEKYLRKSYIASWGKALRSINPRVVIAIMPDQAVCVACHKLNIPIYEMQHGVISNAHEWYSETMKNTHEFNERPTGIFFWDKASIPDWMFTSNINLHITGHPWLNRFIEKNLNDELIQNEIQKAIVFDNTLPTILISLQPYDMYENSHKDNLVPQSIIDVIKKTESQYNWCLRLHPVQIAEHHLSENLMMLDNIFSNYANVEYRKSSMVALPALLSQIDLHITDFSSTTIECALMGIKTALINPNLKTIYKGFYQAEQHNELAEIIKDDQRSIELWIIKNINHFPQNTEVENEKEDIFGILQDHLIK